MTKDLLDLRVRLLDRAKFAEDVAVAADIAGESVEADQRREDASLFRDAANALLESAMALGVAS